MGKNHRHKKHLKSERAKIKLKATKTKFLPKGQNVTDLSFKIRPIILTEQLRDKKDEPVSSRKLNLKEILSRLHHHNSTMKYENCQQLKELIRMENEEFLKQNLSKILTSICPLTLDIERKIRKEAINVLNEILKLSTSANISSFFDVISSFLRCAMTHINQNVQEDSLLFLDGLLMHVPDLVAKNSNKILVNFFTLISKFKSDSKYLRTIAENLKSKYTGVKWRIQVLVRLERILLAVYDQNLVNRKSNEISERIIEVSKTNFAPIYIDKYENKSQLYKNDWCSGDHMVNYIDTLMPLLSETWLEVAPSNVTNVPSGQLNFTTVKQETASTLHCLLTILYLLYQLAEITDQKNNTTLCSKFKTKACIGMFNIMLQSFPYLCVQDKQQKRENDSKCIKENLKLCYLFCVQYKNVKTNELVGYAKKILEYLNFCLLNRKYVEKDQAKLLLSIIKVTLQKNLPGWRKMNLEMDTVIENALHYYLHNNQLSHEDEIELLFLLFDIIDQSSEKQRLLAERASNMLLNDSISSKDLDFLLLRVKKNIAPLQECLRKKLTSILGNIKNIRVVGIELEIVKVVRILSLFYYIPLDAEDLEALRKFSVENSQYESVVTSISQR